MKYIIHYGKGKPEVREEEFDGTYRQAVEYAASHAHGWGYEIDRAEGEKRNEAQ